MTFWQWLTNNWVKTLSTVGAMNSALIAAVAAGMFNKLLDDVSIQWLGLAGFFMNAFLIGVGVNNTTKERVAAAMETAIKSTPSQQGGFARAGALVALLFVCVPLIVVMPACTTLGIPNADTFNKRAVVAYSTIEGTANLDNTLVTTGKLSKADARNVLSQLQHCKTGIDLATQLYASTPALGEDKLQTTLAILNALNTYVKGIQ